MIRGLGRKPSPRDDRDYGVRQLKAMIEDGTAVPVVWSDTEILDQGTTQHCVAFGTGGMLNCDDENHVDPHYNDEWCHAFYYEIKKYENEPEQEDGAFPRDGLQLAKNKGWISAYARLQTLQEIYDWLVNHGPVLVGTDWYEGMMTPDADSVVGLTGDIVGGHCWFHQGLTVDGKYFISVNSWGTDYGKGGTFQISLGFFSTLLYQGGEAWAAVQPAPTPAPKRRCRILQWIFG